MGLTMQSQPCLDEVSTMELVEQGHPEDCARTASDSCQGQPRRQCLPTWAALATSSRPTAAHLLRRGSSEQGRSPASGPGAFASPSPHRPGGEARPHLGSNLACFSSDMTLGKSISLNRFLHL